MFKLPEIKGVIRRRILVNYRVDPEVIQRELPANFRPKLHKGSAIAGICLIRLEQIRPTALPGFLGMSSENAAHRIAVCWEDTKGQTQEGVYIPRRDTDSILNQLIGGRLFPGEHNAAQFQVTSGGERINLKMKSNDGMTGVEVRGRICAELPPGSGFASLRDASKFFENGSIGYSVTRNSRRLDGLQLRIKSWEVEPLQVEHVASSYFDDPKKFPDGSIQFDCALLMRNIEHEWHAAPDLFAS